MTKEEIFPLYLINPKQQIKCLGKIYDFTAYSNWTKTCQLFIPAKGEELSHSPMWKDIINCQLVLKKISGMSEEDINRLCFYTYGGLFAENDKQQIINLLEGKIEIRARLNIFEIVAFVIWLIKNGYALDDNWFTNGLAVEDKGE